MRLTCPTPLASFPSSLHFKEAVLRPAFRTQNSLPVCMGSGFHTAALVGLGPLTTGAVEPELWEGPGWLRG